MCVPVTTQLCSEVYCYTVPVTMKLCSKVYCYTVPVTIKLCSKVYWYIVQWKLCTKVYWYTVLCTKVTGILYQKNVTRLIGVLYHENFKPKFTDNGILYHEKFCTKMYCYTAPENVIARFPCYIVPWKRFYWYIVPSKHCTKVYWHTVPKNILPWFTGILAIPYSLLPTVLSLKCRT